jgi:hypothetical protein
MIYTDIIVMLKSMSAHAKKNPTHMFLPMDTPPRLGYVAYDPNADRDTDDVRGWWEISLHDLRDSFANSPECLRALFLSANGRRQIADNIGDLFKDE